MAKKQARLMLSFRDEPADEEDEVRRHLSAVAQTEACVWLASDESACFERLSTRDWEVYADHSRYALHDFFDLPERGDNEEADIEGLDVEGGYLWLTGSHSLRRKKPKGNVDADSIGRLAKVEAQANRYLLGRIPLSGPDENGRRTPIREAEDGRLAACVPMSRGGNALIRALRQDEHLWRFLEIPAKENGFDVEGLAVRGDRIFLGLRGPVLRGWAIVLELQVGSEPASPDLHLTALGPNGEPYRKHFLDLGGLGIRELCWNDDDLLLLGGPAMDHDGPMTVFSWKNAAVADGPQVTAPAVLDVAIPRGKGGFCDKAEGLCLYRRDGKKPVLLVVYDSPCKGRLENGGHVFADVIALPKNG